MIEEVRETTLAMHMFVYLPLWGSLYWKVLYWKVYIEKWANHKLRLGFCWSEFELELPCPFPGIPSPIMSLLCIFEEVPFSVGLVKSPCDPEGQFLQCLVETAGPDQNSPLLGSDSWPFWNYKHQIFWLHVTFPLFLKVPCSTFKIKVN